MAKTPQIAEETPVEYFSRTGLLPTGPDDSRRFPRYYFRWVAEALIYKLGRDDEPSHCFVLTRDLSRGGISLLHTHQVFPSQRIDLIINGATRPIEVVQCRRLKDGRYVVGCRFVKTDRSVPSE